ncbi:MAG: uracil-DNA glycosylase [Actinomycetota bacterium]|nr:uracil-DNA glycosylase [Actinomycetota bacterium]
MENTQRREKLKDFFYSIKKCDKCELSETRTNFVFGSGNANSKLMFVGEAPGKNEDLQGKPFVGQAGKLLDVLLSSIGFTRNEIFIANVLKCRPPQNRDPRIEEINSCKNYLFKQIEIIEPLVICTLGKYSTQLLLNTEEGITGLRGRIFKIGNTYILPINHPAAAIYTPSRMEILKIDFKRAAEVIKMLESKNSDLDIIAEDSFKLHRVKNMKSTRSTYETEASENLAKAEIKSNAVSNGQETSIDEDQKSSTEQMGLF